MKLAQKIITMYEGKSVVIPNTTYEIKKIAMSANGNKTIYFLDKGKNKKIQTNGNMPNTHRLGLFKTPKQLGKLSDDELKMIGQEIDSYFKSIG